MIFICRARAAYVRVKIWDEKEVSENIISSALQPRSERIPCVAYPDFTGSSPSAFSPDPLTRLLHRCCWKAAVQCLADLTAECWEVVSQGPHRRTDRVCVFGSGRGSSPTQDSMWSQPLCPSGENRPFYLLGSSGTEKLPIITQIADFCHPNCEWETEGR